MRAFGAARLNWCAIEEGVQEPMAATARREARWRFAPSATVPAQARKRLGKEFSLWGLGPDDVEAAVLVANELVSNAVEHARTELELTVKLDGAMIAIRVRDGSPDEPRHRPHDFSALRGRGLQVVAALAFRWGWTSDAEGKTVWADVLPGTWPTSQPV